MVPLVLALLRRCTLNSLLYLEIVAMNTTREAWMKFYDFKRLVYNFAQENAAELHGANLTRSQVKAVMVETLQSGIDATTFVPFRDTFEYVAATASASANANLTTSNGDADAEKDDTGSDLYKRLARKQMLQEFIVDLPQRVRALQEDD